MRRTKKPAWNGAGGILLWPQAWSIVLVVLAGPLMAQQQAEAPGRSVELPKALSDLRSPDQDAHTLIRVREAREKFKVDGSGLAIAVVSTGVNVRHRTFSNHKVLVARNFSGPQENDDVTDAMGEGSHLAATVAGNPLPTFGGGLAPGAAIVAVKVFGDQTTIDQVNRALGWIQAHLKAEGRPISVVLLALGTGGNFKDPKPAIESQQALRKMATIIAALSARELPSWPLRAIPTLRMRQPREWTSQRFFPIRSVRARFLTATSRATGINRSSPCRAAKRSLPLVPVKLSPSRSGSAWAHREPTQGTLISSLPAFSSRPRPVPEARSRGRPGGSEWNRPGGRSGSGSDPSSPAAVPRANPPFPEVSNDEALLPEVSWVEEGACQGRSGVRRSQSQ